MSLSPQQVFFVFTCWCMCKRSFSEAGHLPFLPKEYLNGMDTCRCVPVTHPCTEEFVAISFLTVFAQPVKVCAQGTRLCCQETPLLKTGTFKPHEDLYYLLVKVPSGAHLSGLSRHLAPTQNEVEVSEGDDGLTQQVSEKGSVNPGDGGGSLLERTPDATTEWNETGVEWTMEDQLYTKSMQNSTLKPDTNLTNASPINTSGGVNVLENVWSVLHLGEPPSDLTECFTGNCYENTPVLSTLSTVDIDATMNISVSSKDANSLRRTESMVLNENITTNDPATQDQTTTTSSLMQDQTAAPSHKPRQVIIPGRTESMIPTKNITIEHRTTQDQTTELSPMQDQTTSSPTQKQTKYAKETESMYSNETITTEPSRTQEQMQSNTFSSVARMNEPLSNLENETSMHVDVIPYTSPSQTPTPITSSRPDTTTITTSPATTTSTPISPGFWEWLFG